MTRRVLVSHRLPELQSGNPALDRWVNEHLQRHVAEVFEQLSYLTPEQGTFTAALRGSGTAGTYELASQFSNYWRLGDFVMASSYIVLAAAITGGGAGNLELTGLPYEKVTDHHPVGAVVLVGVNWAAGASLSCTPNTTNESSVLHFQETNDNAANTLVPVTGLAANDLVVASICYLTNGERST